MSSVVVERVVAAGDEVMEAVQRLLPQLSGSAVADPAVVASVVESAPTSLFVARLDGRIVGMASLVVYPLVTGMRGHVDDVVVDESARGHGCARALLQRLIEEAERNGVRSLELTSRPSRAAAIALYESVGFVRRETGVFRYAG
ncbi:GNAT family N-acetyltransferase [uncultured Leifsonia sp.]|uniref:GNAT family N-acetyltransferase n=1 Tax=uncultured Leifsonia sp. TaxID=340359 RepID=UPI0028D7475B|nr:GNAT family N-acetyltransferase [uncultured Leifsonia sp.]